VSKTPKPGASGWYEHLAEGNAKQARKRVVADALIRDTAGRVLLVKPNYKEGWDLPGGMAEANEPPIEAVKRELIEELGLALPVRGLLCIDWVPPHGPWDDLLAFIFDVGDLPPDKYAELRPHDDELSECAFFGEVEALQLLGDRQRLRTRQALAGLKDGIPRYLENGRPRC